MIGARPKAYDDEEYIESLSGSASAAGQESDLAEALLEATGLLTKIGVLLAEASADDWREVRPRIMALRTAIKMLPKTAPRKRRVGY